MGIKKRIFSFVTFMLFAFHLNAQERSTVITDKISIRFIDINHTDFDKLEQKYGLILDYCILDGLCSFQNTLPLSKQDLVDIKNVEENIRYIRFHKKSHLKLY